MKKMTVDVVDQAFSAACKIHSLGAVLTPTEQASAPSKIREYVHVLVSSGERDPVKIARTAACLMREHEQVNRSGERVPCRRARTRDA